jgi:hypothetical protein
MVDIVNIYVPQDVIDTFVAKSNVLILELSIPCLQTCTSFVRVASKRRMHSYCSTGFKSLKHISVGTFLYINCSRIRSIIRKHLTSVNTGFD